MKYFAISILILILGILGVFGSIREKFQEISSPIEFGLSRGAQSLKEVLSFLLNIKNIRDQNLKLITEKRELESLVLGLKKAAVENEFLKNQLKVKNTENLDVDYVLAGVMGNPNDPTNTTILIDKGRRHGLKVGDNVLSGNFFVGVVTEVFSYKSVVQLITSPSLAFTVYNMDSVHKTEGLARGKFGTSVEMTKVLTSEELKVGDQIVTSGKDGKVIPDLLVGKVSSVSSDVSSPLKSADLELYTDLLKLSKVFVIVDL